jgi:hypothetical protein
MKITFQNQKYLFAGCQIIIGLLSLAGCSNNPKVKVENVQLSKIKDTNHVPIPPAPTGLKVRAYLIYDDSTSSTFDVLNDKTKALWNVIIAGGDAIKPSNSTRIILTGKLDSLRTKIFNGKKKVIDQMLPNFSGDFEFIIKKTGCELVKVVVIKKEKTVFQDTIPFNCGE